MTRRFLDDVRSDLATLLVPDGASTALELNALMQDMIDSSIQDEAFIHSTAPTLGVPTTTDYTVLSGVFHTQGGGDGVFLKPDFANSQIITNNEAGFTYVVHLSIIITDLNNNREIEFAVYQNGVDIGISFRGLGRGGSRPLTGTTRVYVNNAGSNDVFQLAVRTPDGANTIDFQQAVLAVVIQPTNNP